MEQVYGTALAFGPVVLVSLIMAVREIRRLMLLQLENRKLRPYL